MAFASIDKLQKVLSQDVFHYARDPKKAAGRALGTLVELITYYVLKSWGLGHLIAIERPLPEYCNTDITHNVEYSLHPSNDVATLRFPLDGKPISTARIRKALTPRIAQLPGHWKKCNLLSSRFLMQNSCTLTDSDKEFHVALLQSRSLEEAVVSVVRLLAQPFAIIECKRVGVEEGMRKGPQTIEKAKQGAYVARTVSNLQKVRRSDGETLGVIAEKGGALVSKNYIQFVREIIHGNDPSLLRRFILTIGVVSNHGNWFTESSPNKELKVLAQSYDWLIFLTDDGLAQFIEELILCPSGLCKAVKTAFVASYQGAASRGNQLTKTRLALCADQVLTDYFRVNAKHLQNWFNVISPKGYDLMTLQTQLQMLARKDWLEIHK